MAGLNEAGAGTGFLLLVSFFPGYVAGVVSEEQADGAHCENGEDLDGEVYGQVCCGCRYRGVGGEAGGLEIKDGDGKKQEDRHHVGQKCFEDGSEKVIRP